MTPVEQAVADVDPLSKDLLPGAGLTWCNEFARRVCAKLGATLGGVYANEQAEWLRTPDAVAAGWASATEPAARQWAQGGGLALATWQNPTGAHGHIAVLVPLAVGEVMTQVAQAGASNFSHGSVLRGFGHLSVEYHTFSPARVCATTPEQTNG